MKCSSPAPTWTKISVSTSAFNSKWRPWPLLLMRIDPIMSIANYATTDTAAITPTHSNWSTPESTSILLSSTPSGPNYMFVEAMMAFGCWGSFIRSYPWCAPRCRQVGLTSRSSETQWLSCTTTSIWASRIFCGRSLLLWRSFTHWGWRSTDRKKWWAGSFWETVANSSAEQCNWWWRRRWSSSMTLPRITPIFRESSTKQWFLMSNPKRECRRIRKTKNSSFDILHICGTLKESSKKVHDFYWEHLISGSLMSTHIIANNTICHVWSQVSRIGSVW